MSDLDAIKFLLDGSYRGAESKFKNQIKSLKEENEILKNSVADLEAKLAESERQYQEYRQIVEKDIEKEIDERMRDTIKEFNLDISQLKQQLAEKDKAIENWETMYRSVMQSCHNGIEEDKRLEKLLAEKDQQIESYKHTIYMNMLNQEMLELKVATQDQDKISFAVDKLEQIKKFLYSGYAVDNEEMEKEIDNQINELKKEMK